MKSEQECVFPPFRLDCVNECLWREEKQIPLRGKTFAVLRCLLEHHGQLVTKAALFTAVWPDTYVNEGALTICIAELRQALGDNAKTPCFIETVHRRGYRFIGKVQSSRFQVSGLRTGDKNQRLGTWNLKLGTHIVGREAELAQLYGWWEKARNGERQIVFVSGETGIGKTSVVEAFLHSLASSVQNHEERQKVKVTDPRSLIPVPWIARGQCIEHYGAGEGYMPVLEALGRLCREPAGEQLIALLERYAPTWLVQMPALLTAADMEALLRRVAGATRERMLREMAEALEALTAIRPLVLQLEDLHWSDVSTLELFSVLARRREAARLLVLGTYRPVEMLANGHPLRTVRQELQLHRHCEEQRLTFLTEEHIAEYLGRRFAVGAHGRAPLQTLARLIHRRTEGNPLFMVNVVEYLAAQGGLEEASEQVQVGIPSDLRQMIEEQLRRLPGAERRMLEAASVVGVAFSAAAVAAGLGVAVEEVEEQCEGFVQQEHFLRASGTAEWPDGTVAACYGFLHTLYREVLYQRLTASRRQRLHQQIGERVEYAYGERASEIAAELAVHFEQGHNYHKAIQYLEQAGKNSTQRVAYAEAVQHLTKALELLKTLPDTTERARQELALQLALSGPLMAIKGYTVPEVEKVLTRASELCRQVGESPQIFSALWRLVVSYFSRGEHRAAHELAEQMMQVAQSVQDQYLLSYAHMALGWTLFTFGEFPAVRIHSEQAIALYDPQQHPRSPFFKDDPRVAGFSLAAWALWYLGYPDQALQRSQEALAVAREMAHPVNRIGVLVWAAMFHLTLRREGPPSGELAKAGIVLATEQGFPYWVAYGTVAWGGALAAQGQEVEGITQMQQGLAALRAIGTEQGLPRQLAVLADAYGRAGQVEEGLVVLAAALALVDQTGERYYEAELYRVKGELLLTQEGKSQKAKGKSQKSENTEPRPPIPKAKPKRAFSKPAKLRTGSRRSPWSCEQR